MYELLNKTHLTQINKFITRIKVIFWNFYLKTIIYWRKKFTSSKNWLSQTISCANI